MKQVVAIVDPYSVDVEGEVQVGDGIDLPCLERLLRHSPWLPAIVVRLDGGRFVLARGVQYLRAARKLGRAEMRAIVVAPSREAVQGVAGFRGWVPDTVLAAEAAETAASDWHVFGLTRPISVEESDAIRTSFAEYLIRTLGVTLEVWDFDPVTTSLEARFRVPLTDHRWAQQYRRFLDTAFTGVGGLSSFQGRKWSLS
jgi:hypothetical protein